MLVSGIAMGFIYAMVGIEYTLIFNASGVLNFSHDKLISLGAYVFAGTFVLNLGMGIIPSIACALLFMCVFGIFLALVVFIPLRNQKQMIYTIMATIMFGKLLMEVVRQIWGNAQFTVKGYLVGTVRLGGAVISKANIVLIVAAALIVTLLQLFLNKTKTGTAMRCVAQNRTAAALMGINVTKNMAITIALSSMICCAIGVLIVPLYNVSLTMSSMIGLKGFAAGVLGGFGYLPGAIVGGLVIGVVEGLASMVLPSVYKDVMAFVLLIGFLLFRPQGILGKRK